MAKEQRYRLQCTVASSDLVNILGVITDNVADLKLDPIDSDATKKPRRRTVPPKRDSDSKMTDRIYERFAGRTNVAYSTVAAFVEELGYQVNSASPALSRLRQDKLVVTAGRGRYDFAPKQEA